MRKLPLALNSLAAALCFMVGTQRAQAQALISTTDVPRTISYQGLLTSTDGIPVHDGEYTVTLSLYSDPTGTVKVWEDNYTTSVTGGVFNVYLGGGKALLPDATAMNRPLWVGIRLDNSAPMYPLTPLSSSPYALNVPDRAITTGKLADGAVTADKVDMNYIAGIAVNGQPVTAKGNLLNIQGSNDIALTFDDQTNTLRLSRPTPATRGDGEKGSAVLDATDGSDNWKGRTTLTNPLTFLTPVGVFNTLAGGASNSIGSASDYSTIVGGQTNVIEENTEHAFIGGGDNNTIKYEGDFSAIVGGQSNQIDPEYQWSFIGGGDNNTVKGSYVVIGGGEDNTADGFHATIGGGQQNAVANHDATIAGGSNNNVLRSGTYGFIGGGENNTIYQSDATIAGGSGNTIGDISLAGGNGSAIGGGKDHIAMGNYSAIPGGESLQTTGYAQTAVGYFNAPRGTLNSRPTASISDDPLFMVGNGAGIGTGTRTNAFEVSYNGHTTVYGTNGPGTIRPAIYGATYTDNILYAWGDITAAGAPSTINAQFGIANIVHVPGSGIYNITINVVDPVTGNQKFLDDAAIVATLVAENDVFPCGSISVTRINANNQFKVCTRNASCVAVDMPFMFHLTGRYRP